jgi:glyoxylase-like metal-dependent hydrolase (beta-lactamase superfamily II)
MEMTMSGFDGTPDLPRLCTPQPLGDGVTVLPSALPVPGLGTLAVNAFLLDGTEPMLVDTGLAALRDGFVESLAALCDPAVLRWIWISHMDADHIGNLAAMLDAAPQARVLTSFLGRGKMMLAGLPVDRVQLVDDNAPVQLGERRLQPLRPPYYDAPETLGFQDLSSRSLFVADAFGAVLPHLPPSAEMIPAATLRDGLAAWSALDAPWLAVARRDALQRQLDGIERLRPQRVLSAHLPPAIRTETLCRYVIDAYEASLANATLRAA